MKMKMIKEEVINHIISSKNMLYREENIEKYVNIIKHRVFIKNPFDRAIAIIFELVIEKEIDPCQIDLISFSKLYIKKLKEEGIDLFIAGKIVLMAWKILRMQSEEIIRNMERKEDETIYDYDIPDWYGEDETFYYTQKVIQNEIPLEKKIGRMPNRKVTLVELINAFEEAKEEIEKRVKRRRSKDKEWKNVNATDITHKEDIERDMKIVMEKLSKLNGRAIPLRKLYGNKDEMLSIFLPLLFLVKEGRIIMWQEEFPYGEIYIKLNHGS